MANGVSSVVPLLFESLIFVDAITSLDEISLNHGITRVLGSQESEVDLSNKKQSWRAPQKLF